MQNMWTSEAVVPATAERPSARPSERHSVKCIFHAAGERHKLSIARRMNYVVKLKGFKNGYNIIESDRGKHKKGAH